MIDPEPIKKRLEGYQKVVAGRKEGDHMDIAHSKAYDAIELLKWVLKQEKK